MTNLKKITVAMAVVVTVGAYLPQSANADGPLRRWWRNITGRNNTAAASGCGCKLLNRQTALSPAAAPATVAANPHNLQPGQCMRTCQQTCSRTVVNYVPQTAYRTSYKRVPVTQYRPVTNSDPCTGCTVTCMKPCTSYTYQVQRVPYTTYKPVYRTETYKVPVTTITNDCATGTCGTCPSPAASGSGTVANFAPQTGCSTCGGGSGTVPTLNNNINPVGQAPVAGSTTQSYVIDPSNSLSTQGGFGSVPADQQPVLNGIANPQSSQRVITPSLPQGSTTRNSGSSTRSFNVSAPAPAPVPAFEQLRQPTVVNFDGYTAKNPVRRSWDYTPVRFASAQLPTERRVTAFVGQVEIEATTPKQPRKSRWVEVE